MTVTNYVWDEVSDNVLLETDEAGTVTAEYTQEPDLYGSVVSQDRDGDTSYYHFDGQGSTRQLTDESQTVTDAATYSAFGTLVAETGSTVNPWRYKGAEGYSGTVESRNAYVRARHYSPVIARWLSEDPSGTSDGINHYIYVHEDPIGNADPTGLKAKNLNILFDSFKCSACGGFEGKWKYFPASLTSRKPEFIIQHLCFEGATTPCEYNACNCEPSGPETKFKCCVFEYIGKASRTDKWGMTFNVGGKCAHKGTSSQVGHLASFHVDPKKAFKWVNPTTTPFTCAGVPLEVGFYLPFTPKSQQAVSTWSKKVGRVGTGHVSVKVKHSCCPREDNKIGTSVEAVIGGKIEVPKELLKKCD